MSDGSVGKRKRSPSTKAVEAVANSADEAAAKKSRASSPKRTAKGAAKEPTAMDLSSSSSSSSAAAPVPAAVAAVAIRELPEAFVQLLLNTPVEQFQAEKFQQKPIYHCQYKDKIVDVFRGLSHMNIMSVPVTKKDENTYSAFIDIMDIVRYVVEHFGPDEMGKDRSFWDLVAESKDFNDLTVQNLAHRPSRWNPIQPMKMGFSLFSAFEMLARTRGLRRLIVVNQNHGLQNLITQSGIIDFLFDNIDLLGAKGKKKLSDCPFFKRVITVKETDQAFEAFKKMSDRNITGVAVIDENGRVKGALSVRDLKLVSTDLRLFWRLHQTIKNFTIKVREEFQLLYKRPKRLVFAHPNDTFESVIRKIHRHKVHRVYIIDNDHRPIGLVSLRDLMTEIIREKPEAASAFVDAYRAAQQNEAWAVPDIEGEAYPDAAADTAVTAATVMPAQVPAAPLPLCDCVPASVLAGGPLDLFRMEFEALQNAAVDLTDAFLRGKELPIVGAAVVPPASSSSSSGAAAAAAPAK